MYKVRFGVLFLVVCFFPFFMLGQEIYPDIETNGEEITYVSDSLGNKIPDFSYSGYQSSQNPIPVVKAKVKVTVSEEDATVKIQEAVDYISSLNPNDDGFRGTVLLDEGIFKVEGTIYIKTSGVVIRGSGKDKTTVLGTGLKREPIFRILGKNDREITDTLQFSNSYFPLGTKKISLENQNIEVEDQLVIHKYLTKDFVLKLGMREFGGESDWVGWQPEDWHLSWDREVQAINDNEIQLDAPLTDMLSIEKDSLKIFKYNWPGRINKIGVENLTVESTFDKENPKDEQHRWGAISIENAQNAWVRQVNFKHLAGSGVNILSTSKKITVEDCKYLSPVSEIAAFRRHAFYTEGQQTLFQRCYSENAYHSFAVGGYGTTGPNAFVQCEARNPYSFSGAIGSYASGVLFDIVNIDGDALSFKNRGQDGRGAGWTAINSVMWESSASRVENYAPPGKFNWAFGTWGQFAGNAEWKSSNSHISPRSLFYVQLEKRLEQVPFKAYVQPLNAEASTSPSLEQAERLTQLAKEGLVTLSDWIEIVSEENNIQTSAEGLQEITEIRDIQTSDSEVNYSKIELKNGLLVRDGKLLTGNIFRNMWWRGSLRPDDIEKNTPHITRFAPGKFGKGVTDRLEDVIDYMQENDYVAFEHNYGLWYDRRMDDHERVRRYDADVWPPFYEQPFNRSGKEIAWDHLSKYNLEDYNDWYWYRLNKFAKKAAKEGKLLIHQQYFQHNILEAGAHWSSSPWRPANNINETGFPEPAPYAGDKRIFVAEIFYDITHKNRRKLHQKYIQKSLESFENHQNVLHLTSKEYTGPLHFVEFWLDEVENWSENSGKDPLIGLSATKDVQDAILKDKKRAKTVDVINIRYWHYKKGGGVYAPEGGKNMAPRQHGRQMSGGKETATEVYKAVREYREKYPEKAVIYTTNAGPRFPWSQLMAGASLVPILDVDIEEFYTELSKMEFANKLVSNGNDIWALANKNKSVLIYAEETQEAEINLKGYKGTYKILEINKDTGKIDEKGSVPGGEQTNFQLDGNPIFLQKKI